jgi:hypothetical protein
MSTPKKMTLPEIRQAGLEALRERLGREGMIRFLQPFNGGHGDYTAERHALLDELTLGEIVQDVGHRRAKPKSPS